MIISQHCGLPFVGAPRFLAVLRGKKKRPDVQGFIQTLFGQSLPNI